MTVTVAGNYALLGTPPSARRATAPYGGPTVRAVVGAASHSI